MREHERRGRAPPPARATFRMVYLADILAVTVGA